MTTPPRLSRATLSSLPSKVALPGYSLKGRTPGVMHFGPGAFHRGHQAAYFDALLSSDPRWSICEVALNSRSTAEALAPQDGLYVLAQLSETVEYRVIGSVAELLGAADRDAIVRRLAQPTTQLVTSTVTEKGYCLTAAGRLDLNNSAIQHDLNSPEAPRSFIGWLALGLTARKAQKAGGITLLSCDNLVANGVRLKQAVQDFASATDRDLADWIGENVRFPSSMVDSITPATDDALRQRVATDCGVYDAWPIQREPFLQWVIEDDFAGERPALDQVGVQFVRSVTAFEDAKLRLLNGAHSTLAYIGLLFGHETVAQAMGDEGLARFIERMMRTEIAPTLHPLEGQSLDDFISNILARFRNPGIAHLLSQIAQDGSLKIPFRLLGTVADRQQKQQPIGHLAIAIAAWLRFLGRPLPEGQKVIDPLADILRPIACAGDVEALLNIEAIFPPALISDDGFRREILSAYQQMPDAGSLLTLLHQAG